jgi:uncharacterized protein YcgL (UPF0745 family)
MKCDVYKSGSLRNAYLFVPAGSAPQASTPESVLTQLGNLSFFKAIEFDENSPLIAADPKEVIENIQRQGFHIQGAEVRTQVKESQDVSEAGAAIGGGILAASLGLGPFGAIAGAIIGALLASSAKGDKNDPDA